MKLMVVESPGKIEALTEILGPGWKVMASYGHIRDLPRKELGIEVPGFGLKYEFVPGRDGKAHNSGKARVDRIRAAASDAELVYLATDPDREGEAIAWHLKDALGLRDGDYARVTFGSIEASAINEALRNQRKVDMQRVHAQEGRRALDRLVGYMVSPVLSDLTGQTLSAGRVQSVALRLIVEREQAIRAFKVTNHFGAVVKFDGGAWSAKWDTSRYVSEEQPYVMDAELATRAAACRSFRVTMAESKEAKQSPPKPFSTVLLLQAASVKLGMSADQVMKAAQALYEGPPGAGHGVITYHRTDSVNFTEDSLSDIRDYAASLGLPLSEKPRKWKEKQDAQAGHQAIRPTDLSVEVAGETEQQRALYRMIRERAIASQLADARYKVNSLRLVALDAGEAFEFVAKGRTMTFAGWRSLTQDDAAEEGGGDEGEETGAVPMLAEGSDKTASEGELSKLRTAPPPRFTEAALFKRLEAEGIGRPATYASIVSNIVQREYVRIEKKQFIPTEVGEMLFSALMKAGFAFMELDFTRDMESQLDRIAQGEASYRDVVSSFHTPLQQELIGVQVNGELKAAHSCPNCSAPMRKLVRSGKPTIWFCTGGDECKTFMDDDKGKPVPRKTQPCPKCSAPMMRFKRKKGPGYVWACSARETGCDTFLDDHNGKPLALHNCPKCSSPLRRYPKKDSNGNLTGRHGWFCTGGDECKTFMEDVDGKPVAIKTAPCPKCQQPMYRRQGQYGWYWSCSNRDACNNMMADDAGRPVPKKAGGSGQRRGSSQAKGKAGGKPAGRPTRRN